MFSVIEQDQAYYRSLISKTNDQIATALATIQTLNSQLDHERTLKDYKTQFEHLASQINKFAPSQTSLSAIGECEAEAASLEARSRNEEIRRKQDQLHVLVSMIRDFRADEKLDAKAALHAEDQAAEAAGDKAGTVDVPMLEDE